MERKTRPQQSRRIVVSRPITPALRNAVELWAQARTDPECPRRQDLLRDKTRIVGEFFTFTDKHPGQVTPLHVATWSAHLEDQGLTAATIYHRLSQLSSWYKWALSDEQLREAVKVSQARMFVTVSCGVLDPLQSALRCARAGHGRPLFVNHETGE
jgi:hypothetical protein